MGKKTVGKGLKYQSLSLLQLLFLINLHLQQKKIALRMVYSIRFTPGIALLVTQNQLRIQEHFDGHYMNPSAPLPDFPSRRPSCVFTPSLKQEVTRSSQETSTFSSFREGPFVNSCPKHEGDSWVGPSKIFWLPLLGSYFVTGPSHGGHFVLALIAS